VIPADIIDRAKKFYTALLGWKIEPTTSLDLASAAALLYQQIITDPVQQDTMNASKEADPKLPLLWSS
jgi:predicted enzyme related to lactoylglutathione lyase